MVCSLHQKGLGLIENDGLTLRVEEVKQLRDDRVGN